MENHVLRRNGLGRIHPLGSLYDARTDMFTGESILQNGSPPLPKGLVEERDIGFSDISNTLCSSLNDRFDQLDIKGDLKLSVLCGMVEVKGSVKYVTAEHEDKRLLSSSLIYKSKTKQQQLLWSNLTSARPYLNRDIIRDPGFATHFVSETEWGFKITICAKTKFASTESKEQITGLAKAVFEGLKVVQGEGKLDIDKLLDIKGYDDNFDFRIYGDINFPPDMTMPSTFEEAVEFIRKAPTFLPTTNNGKGVPLFYTLQPLTRLQDICGVEVKLDNIFKTITDHAVTQCFQIFEDYATLKQEVAELGRVLEENKQFVSRELREQLKGIKNDAVSGEAAYKSELMEQLTLVRSGEAEPSVLQGFIKKFLDSREDSPKNIMENLTIFNRFKEKVELLENLKSDGALYVGTGESLSMAVMKNRATRNIYVLNYFETLAYKDVDSWRQAIECFVSLQKQLSENHGTMFIFADRENNIDPPINRKPAITLAMYVSGKMVKDDLIPDMLADLEQNLGCSDQIDATQQKPTTLVSLEIPCPGYFQGSGCSSDRRTFSCRICRIKLQYDYHGYNLSCKCGMFSANTAKFKCEDAGHGENYEEFSNKEHLKKLLDGLKPKEFNILILGETGVGKSTWINGMLNYATYSSLGDALEDPPSKCFIPSKFILADLQNGTSKTIYLGQPNKNESDVEGQSATQMPKSYSFIMDGTVFRLIDTPGLGDTRGLEQDRENVNNILGYLAQYEEIHGIAILMKPNDARLNVLFDFCLKELLRHLHKDATKNIVFVFTNARGTLYRPGDTYPVLKEALSKNKSIGIKLTQDNVYCMDNESIRFLAACNMDVQFSDREKQLFSESWDRSVEETSRLLQHIRFLTPHISKATVTLNESRHRINALCRPLALITENITHNIEVCQKHARVIAEREKNKKGLEGLLFVPAVGLRQIPLGFPQTVCTASKCTDIRTVHGRNVNHYKTICHDHCYLEGVTVDTIPEPRLQGCRAMKDDKNCRHCGCFWTAHMHITYSHESFETKEEVKTTKESIVMEEREIGKAQGMIKELNTRIQEYREEEKVLLEVSAEFGSFLRNNAIIPYNDAMKGYLQYLINAERETAGCNSVSLDGLEKALKDYEQEVRVLELAKNQGGRRPRTPEEIQQLMDKLFNLPHFGGKIREGFNASTTGKAREYKIMEESIRVPPKKQGGFLSKFKKFFSAPNK